MHKIFISYRREDSIETVGRIFDWLDLRLAPNTVFMDVTSIAPGSDFRTAIEQTISSASVLLAIIGPRWLTLHEAAGTRRLDNPHDFVRTELELAIQHSIPIIPLLVQDAKMPSADDLPAEVASLAYRNAVKVRPNPDFPEDMARVLKGIESLAPDIVFSQPAEKGSERDAKKPVEVKPGLPPIPDGGRTEPGFYYTKVILRQIKKDGYLRDNEVRKEFALRDSPTRKHEIAATFKCDERWVWEGPYYKLIVLLDDKSIANVTLVSKHSSSGEERKTSSPYYDESTIVDGHTYRVKYRIEATVSGRWYGNYLINYHVVEFEVTVDGFTLLKRYDIDD